MLDLHPTFPVPGDDPFPDLTERFRSAGAFDRNLATKRLTDLSVTAIRDTVQSVVNGLQSDHQSFRAVFGKSTTARTDMVNRIVHIGTKAMDDPAVSDGRLAAIMVGLAYHEVAHINHDRETALAAFKAATDAKHVLAHLMPDTHNIAQDVRIEYLQRTLLPGYADCLDVAMFWINGVPLRHSVSDVGLDSRAARSLFFASVRAPWVISDWSGAPDARQWGHDWARRFERLTKPGDIVAAMMEALDKMATWLAPTEGGPTPKPPVIDEPPPGGGSDDDDPGTDIADDEVIDEPPPTGKGKGKDEPEGEPTEETDDGDPGDDTGDGDDESEDEPTDGPSGTEDGDDGDDPTDGGDEPGDDESEGDLDDGGDPVTTDTDSRGEWGDDLSEMSPEAPVTSPERSETEGADGDLDLADLDFPTCSSVAAKGDNDTYYDSVATRVARSREASNVRTISSPGWPDRKVRRIWDWDGKPTE